MPVNLTVVKLCDLAVGNISEKDREKESLTAGLRYSIIHFKSIIKSICLKA